MDLMKIRSHTVLHIVDLSINFSAARFLRGDSVADVWSAFIQCWASVYTGFPDTIKADQGSIFTATEFEKYGTSQGIKIELSGVESHNSLGAGERYHDSLRRIFDKILFEHPSIDPPITLSLAIKAMNDSMNCDCLVPSLLVFGILSRFPSSSSSYPKQSERMRAITMARLEMETITAELCIQQALLKNLPPASKLVLQSGQKVLVYREKENPHWTGPFKIVRLLDKQVFIDRNGTEVQHSVSQIKPYVRDPESLYSSTLYSMLHPLVSQKPSTPSYSLSNTFLSDNLHPSDPRCKWPEFAEASRKEIKGLVDRGTWKIVLKQDVPKGANILSGRYVLVIKNVVTDKPVFKARLVVQGHKDKDKNILVHNSTNLRQSSTLLIAFLAAIHNFRIWSHDVNRAYLQSSEKRMRKVYLKPPKELNLSSDELLELIKPLYGLPDAGDYWDRTMADHLRKDLNMVPTYHDIALHFLHGEKELQGLVGVYVDDSLICGNKNFMDITEKTLDKFES